MVNFGVFPFGLALIMLTFMGLFALRDGFQPLSQGGSVSLAFTMILFLLASMFWKEE